MKMARPTAGPRARPGNGRRAPAAPRDGGGARLIGKSLCLSFIINFILFMKFIKIKIISIIVGHVTLRASLKLGGD